MGGFVQAQISSISMKRFLWWTFTVAAAVSAALFIACAVGLIYQVLADPAWLRIRISTPLKTIRPLIVYSILPVAWIIVRRRRRRLREQRGFELMPQ